MWREYKCVFLLFYFYYLYSLHQFLFNQKPDLRPVVSLSICNSDIYNKNNICRNEYINKRENRISELEERKDSKEDEQQIENDPIVNYSSLSL